MIDRLCAGRELSGALCGKQPSFNVPGSKKGSGIYCATHKLAGMVDVKSPRDRIYLFQLS